MPDKYYAKIHLIHELKELEIGIKRSVELIEEIQSSCLDADHFFEPFRNLKEDAYYFISTANSFRTKDSIGEETKWDLDQVVAELSSILVNMGSLLKERGQFDKAKVCFKRALELNPNNEDAHLKMSLLVLHYGDFQWSLKEFDWLQNHKDSYTTIFSQPLWDGCDITGHTILLHSGTGFGDTLQWIRYAPILARNGAKVIVECSKELASLIRNVEGVQQVVVKGEQLPEFDVHCSFFSLLFICDTKLENIPANIPYIIPEVKVIQKWKGILQSDTSKFRIGLAWEGSNLWNYLSAKRRSLPLDTFSTLAELEEISFYSLQKGEAAEDTKEPPEGMKLFDYTDEINDFSDTSALIQNLDLVISIDTAVAHLAGALGKPVWTLLPFVADWRWLLNREDSPWYPTMRLFRQPAPGDWETGIARIKDDLLRLLT